MRTHLPLQKKSGATNRPNLSTETLRRTNLSNTTIQRSANAPLMSSTPSIQAISDRSGLAPAQSVAPQVGNDIAAMSGAGHPLSRRERSFFESRFGQNFGDVRIHTGESAMRTSASLNAKAFTIGRDIFFGSGEYAPHSREGRRLMAHELTHTIQQKKISHADNRISRKETEKTKVPRQTGKVYACSTPVQHGANIFGFRHAFLRLGSSDPGNFVYGMTPVPMSKDGTSCVQGRVDYCNSCPDARAPGGENCKETSLSIPKVHQTAARSGGYPRGAYCVWGPNSNTYVGWVLKQLNTPRHQYPPGDVPGIDGEPPEPGTFGPDRRKSAFPGGCSHEKECGTPS
jgi:Domain of unknown function (DUF4157)